MKQNHTAAVLVAGLVMILTARAAAFAADPGWEGVDKVFGSPGRDLPGDVRRYGWPRSDLHVTVGGVPVEPGLALGAWAAFKRTGDDAFTMGDLVLTEPEVEPVLGQLVSGGLDILAIHNHLIGETPHVLYVHFHGHGDPAALARTLKAALAKTKTPPPGKTAAKPTAEQEKTFEKLQEALGHNGTMSGTVLQVGVARAEPIMDGGRGSSAEHGHEQPHELPDGRRAGRDDG